jgi:hypothetical protein
MSGIWRKLKHLRGTDALEKTVVVNLNAAQQMSICRTKCGIDSECFHGLFLSRRSGRG